MVTRRKKTITLFVTGHGSGRLEASVFGGDGRLQCRCLRRRTVRVEVVPDHPKPCRTGPGVQRASCAWGAADAAELRLGERIVARQGRLAAFCSSVRCVSERVLSLAYRCVSNSPQCTASSACCTVAPGFASRVITSPSRSIITLTMNRCSPASTPASSSITCSSCSWRITRKCSTRCTSSACAARLSWFKTSSATPVTISGRDQMYPHRPADDHRGHINRDGCRPTTGAQQDVRRQGPAAALARVRVTA